MVMIAFVTKIDLHDSFATRRTCEHVWSLLHFHITQATWLKMLSYAHLPDFLQPGHHPSLKLHSCGYARPSSIDQTQTSCLVRRQPSNNLGHLLISVDSESLVLGHTRQLHVLAIQLLLHDLLERLEREHLGFGQGKRLVEFVLEFGLRALGSGADGFGVIAVECARRFGVVAAITISFFPVDSTVGVEVCLSRRGKCCVCVTYRLGPSSSYPAIKSATPNGLDMMLSSPSAPSPNLSARSHIACVQLSTRSGSA